MFVHQSKQELVVRVLLIAVILFNALAPTTASASSLGQKTAAGREGSASPDMGFDPYPGEEPDDLSRPAVAVPLAHSSKENNDIVTPALLLSIDPDFLTPRGSFTLSWTIDDVTLDENNLFSLQLALPADFSLEGKYEGQFDPASHILTIPVTALQGQIHLKAGNSTNDVMLQAVLFRNTEILAQASLFLAAHEQFMVDRKGGEVKVKDHRVRLQFPNGVLPEKTIVDIGQPSGDEAPPYSLSGHPFEIKAHGQASRELFSKFSQDITIFASYADLNVPAKLEDNLYIHWYNAETGEWVPLPTNVNKKTKTLEALTNHFTVFDINVNHWQASHLPTVDSFQVSNFTGAATYSLSIAVPPGPGGFQPSLSLNYNSQIVDQSTTVTQSSWVGMGWSLDTGSIELDSHGTNDTTDDTYFLNVGGVSTRIVKAAGGSYHAADENFWKISYDGNWTVWDKQGNIYYFNHIAQRVYSSEGSCTWQPYLWSLTKVKNIFDVEILYTYQDQIKEVRCSSYIKNGIAAVYPTTVTYASSRYRVRFDSGSSPNRLDYQTSWETDLLFHAFQSRRLQNIYIEQDLDGDGNFETVLRRYAFQYANDADADVIFPGLTWTKGGKTTTLRSVREYGVGGTTALPATTFTYGDNLHLTRAENGYGGAVEFRYEDEPWSYTADARPSYTIRQNFGNYGEACLTGVPSPWRARDGYVDCVESKGALKIWGAVGTASSPSIWNISTSPYTNTSKDLVRPGGVYKLTAAIGSTSGGLGINVGLYDGARDNWYESVNGNSYIVKLPADASKAEPLIQETGGVGGNYAYVTNFAFNLLPSVWRVVEKRIYDGVHPTPYMFSYNYSAPAVNTPANSPNSLCTSGCQEYIEKFSEFRGHGQVTETGPDGRQTITTFYQDDFLKGRPIETTVMSGSQPLTKMIYQYSATSLPVSSQYSPYIGVLRTWVKSDWVESRVYPTPYAGENIYAATRQVFMYETNYGNLIKQTDQAWDGNNWSVYRLAVTDYFPNTLDVYLVGFPGRQQIRDASGKVIAETLNIYDSQATYSRPPTAGKLTAVRTWVDGPQTTGRYSQVAYGYDAWGNQTRVTTYDGYGNALTVPTGMRNTTTTFDSVFHAYPISQSTPPPQSGAASLVTTWSYDYDRNGTNDYILGVPTRETDPNGNVTTARYDIFGRMIRLIRPGDSSAQPTIAVDYHDTNLFWTEIRQRIDGPRYLTIRRHYDGIGRQTYIENGNTNAGMFVLDHVVSYRYPAFNILEQSMPYAPGAAVSYTTTVADVLGRPLTVTAPNGNIVSYNYNGLVSTITDAKGYSTTTTTDVWGRVQSVVPPTGPGITYTYDLLNNLSTATRGGVTTEINYDRAGRKTSMSDPDMGNWTYAYDALGNLTSQTDARGCQLNLSYDMLNRLLTKNSSGTGCGIPVNTSYTYDVGANGLGQRTSMSDDSGSTSWSYDTRGRMMQEIKTITGASPFTTSWWYNSADLPASMTYPDAEVLTYTYNDNGQLDSVSSSLGDTYLANTEYDEAGRITSMDYGASAIRKTFDYFDWREPEQGGLLNSAVTTRLSDQATLQSFTYIYDENANVESITDSIAGPQTQTFGYDPLNRLTSAVVEGGTAGLYSENYDYDPDTGNLALKGDLTYLYEDPAHAHAVTSAGDPYAMNTYQYDENGNMITRDVNGQGYLLDYDAENRLASVEAVGVAALPTLPPSPVATHTPTSPAPTASPIVTSTGTLAPPIAATLVSPLGAITDTTPMYTWNAVAGATWYYLEVDGPAGMLFREWFAASEVCQGSTCSVMNITATGGGAHTWWVQTWNSSGYGPWSAAMNFSLPVSSVPGAAALIAPSGSMNDATPTFSWTAVPGATWYYLEVDGPSGNVYKIWYKTAEVCRDNICSVTPDTTLTSAVYRWWIQTWNNSGYGPWSTGMDFSITTLGPTTLISPSGDLHDATPLYTWNVVNEATRYNLWVDGPSGNVFKQWVQASEVCEGSICSLEPATELSGGAYTWWIQTGNAAEAGTWSPAMHFSLPTQTSPGATTAISPSGSIPDATPTYIWSEIPGTTWYYLSVNGPSGNVILHWYTPDDVNCDGTTCFVTPSIRLNDGTYTWQVQTYSAAGYGPWSSAMSFTLIAPTATVTPSQTATATEAPSATFTPLATDTPSSTPTPTDTATPTATFTPTPAPAIAFTRMDFTYDGDGKRVKSMLNPSAGSAAVTTYFVGAHYEVEVRETGTQVTKYYYAGTQRIAMRTNGILNYLLGDHLGSTSLSTDAAGNVTSEVRYKAWGEVRYASGAMPTDYTYTGQYSYTADFGLMYYNARWYDPSLGRFAQADTMMPSMGNVNLIVGYSEIGLLKELNLYNIKSSGKLKHKTSISYISNIQDLDRYNYTSNNPIKYIDPNGHDDIPVSTWEAIMTDVNLAQKQYPGDTLAGSFLGTSVGLLLVGVGEWVPALAPIALGFAVDEVITRTNTDLGEVQDLMNDVLAHNNGNEVGEDNTINGGTDYYFEVEMVDIYDSSGNYLHTECGLTTTLWVKVHGEWQQYTMGNEAWVEIQKQFNKHGVNPTTRTRHVRQELMGT